LTHSRESTRLGDRQLEELPALRCPPGWQSVHEIHLNFSDQAGRTMCSKFSIRVQVLHLAAGGLSAGHPESGAAALEVAQIPVWTNSCSERFV
jgi:hypothetical protein